MQHMSDWQCNKPGAVLLSYNTSGEKDNHKLGQVKMYNKSAALDIIY